jgi:15,16-dihydrobiliverdin:ferredoxin oxidoreductase
MVFYARQCLICWANLPMYKPFQQYLEQDLFQRFDLQSQPIPLGLDRNVSDRGKNQATIQSWCYCSPELRKIRYTYIDAGESAQVFNSVIYPSHHYDIPLLGIDLLSFGKSKILVVIDFQPLFRDEAYQAKYVEHLKEIYQKYDDLAQNLGMKFYDANQYFSKYLLFAKTDADTVESRVFPAFQDYLSLYWQMLEKATPLTDPEDIQRVVKAQKDYDQYSADRDPAHGLFSSYFGPEWAERFLYDFLFEDAVPLAVGSHKR